MPLDGQKAACPEKLEKALRGVALLSDGLWEELQQNSKAINIRLEQSMPAIKDRVEAQCAAVVDITESYQYRQDEAVELVALAQQSTRKNILNAYAELLVYKARPFLEEHAATIGFDVETLANGLEFVVKSGKLDAFCESVGKMRSQVPTSDVDAASTTAEAVTAVAELGEGRG